MPGRPLNVGARLADFPRFGLGLTACNLAATGGHRVRLFAAPTRQHHGTEARSSLRLPHARSRYAPSLPVVKAARSYPSCPPIFAGT